MQALPANGSMLDGESILLEKEKGNQERTAVENQEGKKKKLSPGQPADTQEKEKKIRRKRRRKKEGRNKTALVVLGVFFLVLAGAYVCMAAFFRTHFLLFTTINGEDFSMKSISQAEAYMKQEVEDYSLTVVCSDGSKEVIDGDSIAIQYTSADELETLMEGQNYVFWPQSLWAPAQLTAQVGIGYDGEKLTAVLSGLDCMNKELQAKSQSAYPSYQNGRYEIIPEVQGTRLDEEKFLSAVDAAIRTSQKTLNLLQADCYKKPKYTIYSEETIQACNTMNQYLSAVVTYDLTTDTEVVDASVIQPWIKLKKKKMKASLDGDAIKDYLQSLADKYNVSAGTVEFTTADGDVVTVKGGSFGGWKIDQSGEYDALVADIKEGKTVTREPEHTGNSRSEKNGGIGDTYAEVDLTDQHMYYIQDGKVILETDVVTGNPNNGNETPQGIYTLSYKTKDAVLRGQKKKNGEYEYETPVKYWMPFNGGIGFHDASWQSSFGGKRYLTHGSHGCVNMPPAKAKELYSLIQAGVPVVCHY